MKRMFLPFAAVVICLILASFQHTKKPLVVAPTLSSSGQTIWNVDKVHTTIKFSVSHMVVAEQEGSFKVFDGSIEHTKADWTDAKINFSIDISSISTDNQSRDTHLKSDDFFNAEKFPKATFTSTSFVSKGNNKYTLNGNLTIRDITRAVSFDVTYGGTVKTKKGEKAGFKATAFINRFDYNLKWDKVTEAGGLVVGKEVEITAKLEFDRPL